MLADGVDYSLVPYTRRSMQETVVSHGALVIAAPIVVWATWKYVTGIEINWVAFATLMSVLIVNLGLVSALARRAVRAQ